VARELAPDRRRSRRNIGQRGVPGKTQVQIVGSLRNPKRASSLATKTSFSGKQRAHKNADSYH
jgi:hypothetical protein